MRVMRVKDVGYFRDMLLGNRCMLGQGLYGRVYDDGDTVIKVWRSDPAYEAFRVAITDADCASVHWPKAYEPVTRVTDGTEYFTFTRLEKLHSAADMDSWERAEVLRLRDWLHSWSNYGLAVGPLSGEQHKVATTLLRLQMDGHSLDLHRGNYMYRKDGTFVITDPVV